MPNWIEIEHVDALPIRGATCDDINIERVAHHLTHARNVRANDPIAYLKSKRGVVMTEDGTLVPTLGGLLCFGINPQQWLPHTGIALTRYISAHAHSQHVIDLRDLAGTLFDMIDQAEEYLWTHSNHGFRLDAGPRRIPLDQYPRTTLRELTVNAVAHRDYRVTGSCVKIELFRNEIEWSSPGGLPPNITINNILKAQYTRNPVIVGFLFDAGYIERRGMGLNTVVMLLEQEHLPFPAMEDTGSDFLIRISGHTMINTEPSLGLSTPLTRIYTTLEQAGNAGLSARELATQLTIPLRTLNNRLRELMEQDLIIRSGSTNNTRYSLKENPNSRH